jgi:hypothetical protein
MSKVLGLFSEEDSWMMAWKKRVEARLCYLWPFAWLKLWWHLLISVAALMMQNIRSRCWPWCVFWYSWCSFSSCRVATADHWFSSLVSAMCSEILVEMWWPI